MKVKEIDLAKLNKAIEKFGSLQQANARLEKERLAIEKENARLKQENKKLAATRDRLADQAEEMNTKNEDYLSQLQHLSNQVEALSYQYQLFCGFLAMVVGSPSVTDSLANLIALLQKLKDSGWYVSKDTDELRSIFIRTVMGDYLKCFRCKYCNTQFVVNKEPHYKNVSNYYQCPSCHASYMVEPDDSFLKAMVSEKQVENTRYLGEVLEEFKLLEPFKAFLNVPCEICNKKIEKWDDYNVKLAIQGIGCGHTACWNCDLGRMKEISRALAIIKNK